MYFCDQRQHNRRPWFFRPAGEMHAGLTPSCSRVLSQYERGTEIRNVRQLSLVSEEELSAIADEMGIAQFDPSLIGSSVVLRGIPDFSHIPPSSRLQNDAGTTLTIDMQNRPCHLPWPKLRWITPMSKRVSKPPHGDGGVSRPGSSVRQLSVGDHGHIPDQRGWLEQS